VWPPRYFLKKIKEGARTKANDTTHKQHTQTTHTTRHYTTTIWKKRKSQKRVTATHVVVTIVVPGQSRNPLQAQVAIWTPPPWAITNKIQTHDRRSLCSDVALVEHSRRSSNETTDPDHYAWGPCLIHRLTPLPRTRIPETALRASPPPSRHWDYHCTTRVNPRLHSHRPFTPPCQYGPSAPPQLQRTVRYMDLAHINNSE
jgi:hypothetical protein